MEQLLELGVLMAFFFYQTFTALSSLCEVLDQSAKDLPAK